MVGWSEDQGCKAPAKPGWHGKRRIVKEMLMRAVWEPGSVGCGVVRVDVVLNYLTPHQNEVPRKVANKQDVVHAKSVGVI
jgi:hypothetical protein